MHYYSLSNYLKETYGEKLYKISLSAAVTCPNRDGNLGTRGCAFCSAGGSGDFAAPAALPLEEQIREAKERVSRKAHADSYIAYFQSYTGTYPTTDLDRLFGIYKEAAERDDIRVLSIATRPDCLGPEAMEMLRELRKIKPLWVELGLQTSNEKTAAAVRRCYNNNVYEAAMEGLLQADILPVTHVILGLPGEAYDDMEASVRYACSCGTWGLKLQLLHVLRGTDLAADYATGKFSTFTLDDYIDTICRLLPQIPPDVVIHRLTGDGPKRILVAPTWSADKRTVLNTMNTALEKRRVQQGSALSR